jgi:hypothetical protein
LKPLFQVTLVSTQQAEEMIEALLTENGMNMQSGLDW